MIRPLPSVWSPSLSSAGPQTHRDTRYDGFSRSVGADFDADGARPEASGKEHAPGSADATHLALRGPPGTGYGRAALGRPRLDRTSPGIVHRQYRRRIRPGVHRVW